jgi:hypothetical protein
MSVVQQVPGYQLNAFILKRNGRLALRWLKLPTSNNVVFQKLLNSKATP